MKLQQRLPSRGLHCHLSSICVHVAWPVQSQCAAPSPPWIRPMAARWVLGFIACGRHFRLGPGCCMHSLFHVGLCRSVGARAGAGPHSHAFCSAVPWSWRVRVRSEVNRMGCCCRPWLCYGSLGLKNPSGHIHMQPYKGEETVVWSGRVCFRGCRRVACVELVCNIWTLLCCMFVIVESVASESGASHSSSLSTGGGGVLETALAVCCAKVRSPVVNVTPLWSLVPGVVLPAEGHGLLEAGVHSSRSWRGVAHFLSCGVHSIRGKAVRAGAHGGSPAVCIWGRGRGCGFLSPNAPLWTIRGLHPSQIPHLVLHLRFHLRPRHDQPTRIPSAW